MCTFEMAIRAVFALSLAVLFFHNIHATTFTFTNNCDYTVWPGALSGDSTPLSSTGFQLAPQASSSLTVSPPWSGRFWARTGCTDSSGKFTCATADCGSGQVQCNGGGASPPASLVEFTIASNNEKDFYDVSLVDGFNLPLSITPQGGSECQSSSCRANINSACPPELSVKAADGGVIACMSACLAFGEPQYCCTGEYDKPEKCPPTNYSMIFKGQCPQAYSYAYDDKSSTFTCSGGADYVITFCPSSSLLSLNV